MISKNFLILFCVIYCFINVNAYYDCEEVETNGKVKSIKVSGCDTTTDEVCKLKRNTNVTFDLEFTTDVDAENLKTVVHGVILGIPKSFVMPNANACKDSGITCPIKSGNTYVYTTQLPVKKFYPKVTVDVKWEIQNDKGKDIVCIMIPAKLV